MQKNKAQEQLAKNSLIQKVDGEFHVRDEKVGVIQAFYSEKEAQEYIDYFNLN